MSYHRHHLTLDVDYLPTSQFFFFLPPPIFLREAVKYTKKSIQTVKLWIPRGTYVIQRFLSVLFPPLVFEEDGSEIRYLERQYPKSPSPSLAAAPQGNEAKPAKGTHQKSQTRKRNWAKLARMSQRQKNEPAGSFTLTHTDSQTHKHTNTEKLTHGSFICKIQKKVLNSQSCTLVFPSLPLSPLFPDI